jgi:hypothetical protein
MKRQGQRMLCSVGVAIVLLIVGADALTKKGYDVNYSWGMGVHSHYMGGAMLPEMMRWLWRDQPVSLDPSDTLERSFRSKK